MVRPNLAALTRQRATYNHLGCRLMMRELKRWLPAWTSTTPAGGAFLWVHVPNTDTKVLQQVAMRHGVTYTDGDILSATATSINRIRLSFSHQPPYIETGIRRLADAWKVLRAKGMSANEVRPVSS
jgi:DNA-binding transcriptional MocR family regulator